MRYQGGKSRIAAKIADRIRPLADTCSTYCEPFLGGAAVAARLGSSFQHTVYSDAHTDLMLMWQAVELGWTPPTTITEDEYRELKEAEPSVLRGFAGFAASFGGKWFGAYARGRKTDGTPRNYVDEASRRVRKDIVGMRGSETIELYNSDYRDTVALPGMVIYADPPYLGVAEYRDSINHDEFWAHARQWAGDGAHVFVSEYTAPAGIQLSASWDVPITIRRSNGLSARENLYHLTPC